VPTQRVLNFMSRGAGVGAPRDADAAGTPSPWTPSTLCFQRRHVPQSVAAKAELEQIMMVPRNIVSPQSNKPVMGIVQDSLLASARMTSRDTFIEQDLLFNLLMWVGDDWDGVIPPPAILKPKPLWTGKQVFSLIIPKLNFKGKGNRFPKKGADTLNWSDGTVLIHQGKLLTGVMDKKILGTSGGSLIHVTWLEKGSEATMYLINRVQTLTNNWLVTVSFSIGIGDAVADQSTMRNIESIIDEAKDKVKQLVQRGQRGELECQPGRTMIESFEAMVNRVLNAARTSAGLSVQDSISEANNVKSMAMAGSKGNDINISQIIACVGQQNVEGKRIPYGFRRRTLPHFAKDDLGPESRGFVENSYLRGLSPQEFFFHAMGGREGLIDTACKTAQTGYLQRRLVKSMESTAVQYDGTVRTNQGHVVQFLYGEDGGDGAWVEKQKFPSLLLGDDALRKAYSINLAEGRDKQGPVTQGVPLDVDVAAACRADPDLETLLEAELDRLKGDRDALRAIFACREPDRDADPFAQLPVNLERLVWAAQKQFECGERLDTAVLDPRVVLEGVTRLCVRIRTCRRDVGESNEQSPEATAAAAAEADDATQLFVILVRSTLAARKVVFEHRLNRAAFDWCVLRRPFSLRRRDVVPGTSSSLGGRAARAWSPAVRQPPNEGLPNTHRRPEPPRCPTKTPSTQYNTQVGGRGRGPLRPGARARRRDVRRARGPVHGRARDPDDAQHLPLCGRECEERHARCPSLE
jgi:DNA-directed RNA polymerase II subunit RPB1